MAPQGVKSCTNETKSFINCIDFNGIHWHLKGGLFTSIVWLKTWNLVVCLNGNVRCRFVPLKRKSSLNEQYYYKDLLMYIWF